jgi:acid phosphatase (class A)
MIKKIYFRLPLFTIIVLSVVLWGCTQQTAENQQPVTSLSKEIKEISPGILEGYLSKEEIPNSLAKDAVLSFPEATEAFNMVLDVKISEETTPHLYMILRRTLADAGLSTYGAKNHYQRARPFMVNNTPICTPKDEALLRKDGAYPSGHTAIGWAWALILAEVFPKQADAILERGKQFGISRNVCNAHWHSDVVYGRMMGAAAVAILHSNTDFMIDLEAAKEELRH